MGKLGGLRLHHVVLEGEEPAFEVDHIVFKSAHQHGEGFMIERRSVGGIDPIAFVLDERAAAAHADHEAAAAHVIEHADFFVNAQRVIERQHVNQGAKPQGPRALDRRSEKDAGACRQPKRRRMVFGQVIAGEAGAFDRSDQGKPFLEERAQGRATAVEMIENGEVEHLGRFRMMSAARKA